MSDEYIAIAGMTDMRERLSCDLCSCSCPFVDNCVGRDNYAAFLLFVTFLAVDLVGMEYVLYLLWRYHHDMRVFAVSSMIYLLLVLLPVAQLMVFHIYLTASNRTTNELLNADRYRSSVAAKCVRTTAA